MPEPFTSRPSEASFTCASCGGTFDKAWSDAESIAEARQLYGRSIDQAETDMLCDDCYPAFLNWYRTIYQKRQN